MKRLAGLLALAFVVFYISSDPTRAAGTAHNIGTGLADVANGIIHFLNRVTGTAGQ
jgi:hypothetical protein